MRSFDARRTPASAVIVPDAMNAASPLRVVEETVMRSLFLTSFLLLVPLTLAFAIYAFLKLGGPGQALIIAAAVIYVVSVFLVTMLGNVPMNNHLASLAYASSEAEAYWSTYGRVWTMWNHVRTAGSAATAACFMLAAVALT